MIEYDPLIWLLPVFGYLEMHYRFPFFPFSRYYKREPEIFADAPYRVRSDRKIPVTIIIKDADRFPITLKSILIRLKDKNGLSREFQKEYHCLIQEHWFEDIIEIDPDDFHQYVRIWVIIEIDIAGENRTVITHNIDSTPQFVLETYIDEESLPGSDMYWWGDLHYHSNYTEDFVEFGASLKSSQKTATALGLDFLAITDHSYDLDDKIGSWSESDPELKKWRESRKRIKKYNSNETTILIPGEEVTCRNAVGRNVHTLALNHSIFFAGSGDGAEKFFRTKSELSISELLEAQSKNSIVIAAHPFHIFSQLARFLLHRGIWEEKDSQLNDLAGFQILNGTFDKICDKSIVKWVRLLLKGVKKFIYAGNDAHGNFNRFHQIKLPLWSTHTNRDHLLGQCRTGVLRSKMKSITSIIRSLKAGRCFITDGPAINITLSSDTESYTLGDIVNSRNNSINIDCISSKYFGTLASLTVFVGIIGDTTETKYSHTTWEHSTYSESISEYLEWHNKPGYLRCHLMTNTGYQCYSNPIWIEP